MQAGCYDCYRSHRTVRIRNKGKPTAMLIRLGYDIEFNLLHPVPFVALLNVHPGRVNDLREPDELRIEPMVNTEWYIDQFGNRCTRFLAPQGRLRIWNSTLIQDSGEQD